MPTRSPERVPKQMRPRYEAVVRLTDAFCKAHLDDDYAALCRRMAAALARKRPSPLARGRVESWASGIVHAAGSTNFLFDPSFEPYMSAAEIAESSGVAPSTSAAKARAIKDALRIRPHDWQWMLPALVERNPLAWMVEVDGVIVDARRLPRAMQEEAARRGLIPYVPAPRGSESPGAAASGTEASDAAGAYPKMSDVLVDVAEPLLESVPEDSPIEVYLDVLHIAGGIWNASRGAGDPEHIEELKAFMTSELNTPPELADEIVSTLHQRAVERHADEERVIVGVDAYFRGGELRVRAMSRFPGEKG